MSRQEELDFLRAKLERLSTRIAADEARHLEQIESLIQSHKRQTEALREGQVERIREVERSRQELERELQQESNRARKLESELRQAQNRIQLIYQSKTWRVGAALARLARPFLPTRDAIAESSISESVLDSSSRSEAPAAPRLDEVVPGTSQLHPLADLYAAELTSVSGASGGRAVGFAVSTVDFGVARGDLFVATGLGRYLRRGGIEPIYAPHDAWYDLSGDLEWVVAMLPAFRPSLAPAGPKIVGWARNEIEYWLEHDEIELFDAILCSSSLAAAEIGKVYSGPVGVLPIGVDLELFEPPHDQKHTRSGVVSTVNQWGRERDVYRALRSSPMTFDLRIYGWARGLRKELDPHHRGLISFFELPKVYWGCQVVLDDFNPTTVGWGAVNSRIFEALAAGALPVTNSRLGLADLGLAALPTYSDPASLNSLVQAVLDDPEGTGALIEQLQAIVKERHSFAKRAQEMAAFLVDLPEKSGISRVIGFAPDYRAGNPYQEMLYSEGATHGVAAIPTDLEWLAEGRALARFEQEKPIFHLHWTAPIIGPSSTEAEALVRVDDTLKAIDLFKARGGRFVWTVHNVLPHEARFEEMEVHLRQELANRADLIHVMCDATREQVGGLYWLPSDRTVTVPHSSYIGIYPDAADREVSRLQLGLAPEDIALLALGGIRPYKDLDLLLAAFDRALQREPRLFLVVAGKPGHFEGSADLESDYRSHPRVIVNFNEILSGDLQYLYKASDVALVPQRKALNSGALLLAYSFGLPVIAPRVGCLSELLDEDAAISFDPDVDESLVDALARAGALANPRARKAAHSIAVSRPVEEMSSAFFDALDQV